MCSDPVLPNEGFTTILKRPSIMSSDRLICGRSRHAISRCGWLSANRLNQAATVSFHIFPNSLQAIHESFYAIYSGLWTSQINKTQIIYTLSPSRKIMDQYLKVKFNIKRSCHGTPHTRQYLDEIPAAAVSEPRL